MTDLEGVVRSIALVSGKGGSGKTLIAAALAKYIQEESSKNAVLIDTDLGTGGVTYYLGFKSFRKTGRGFSDLVIEDIGQKFNGSEVITELQEGYIPYSTSEPGLFRFVSIGNHRAIFKNNIDQDDLTVSVGNVFRNIIRSISSESNTLGSVVIADCRGGVDSDSLAVCAEVDDIIVISETDATSIQACQHLIDVLSDKGLSNKIQGFMLNKVFDDPSQLAKAGTSLFRSSYLGSIPFDIEAVRKYVSGDFPEETGLFNNQLKSVAAKIFTDTDILQYSSYFGEIDFSKLSLRDPAERTGSVSIAVLLSYVLILILLIDVFRIPIPEYADKGLIYASITIAILAMVPEVRVGVGRITASYGRIFARLARIRYR